MRASPSHVRRLSYGDEEERYLSDIRSWAAERNDCLWLGKVEPFRSCRVAGVVRRMRLDPASQTLDVTISDGVSTLLARWPLERSSPPMKAVPGTGVILDGMIVVDGFGTTVLTEPHLEIAGRPAVS